MMNEDYRECRVMQENLELLSVVKKTQGELRAIQEENKAISRNIHEIMERLREVGRYTDGLEKENAFLRDRNLLLNSHIHYLATLKANDMESYGREVADYIAKHMDVTE